MNKFCGMCGAKREQEDKFCSRCGAKFENETIEIKTDDLREELTFDSIKRSLEREVDRANYYFPMFGIIVGAVFALFAVEVGVVLVLLGVIGVIATFCKHKRYRSDKIFVAEKICVKKTHSFDPEVYGLVFADKGGRGKVFLEVSEWACDAAAVGEEFYLVFQGASRTPCLYYSKRKWILKS